MSRSVPWRNTCPEAVTDILNQLPSCQLLLVKRVGPTSFLLSKRDGLVKYRTSIGDPHSCSCDASREQCIHVVFVLCKVFFLPRENPLVWQRSLVAAEIDEILRSENRLRNAWKNVDDTRRDVAVPRPIEEGDVCPICFEEFGNDTSLDYCGGGCGKYIHTRCFKQYKRHNLVGPLRCPYCRSLWTNTVGATSKRCSGCKKYANGSCYKCLFCQEYFLCSDCFHRRETHSHHPFSLVGTREVAERHEGNSALPMPVSSEPTVSIPEELHPLMYREIDPEDYETLLRLDDQNSKRKLTAEEFSVLHSECWSSGLLTDECNICLDTFDVTSGCVWLPCGHFFHTSCAQRWLTEHVAECPIDHIPVVVDRADVQSLTVNSSSSAAVAPHILRPSRPRARVLPRRRLNVPYSSATVGVEPPARRNAERQRGSDVSLPFLELQAVSLGVGRRRGRYNEQFFYGTV
ncbi:Ring finger domain containing protein, putative [Trypanosoma equiperdum]|uniref:RING-type domain-containing protein n=3 Tax=Trypanozoon TaxID=39700 RepID=Q57ZW8_TRYB2|nr:hypothetical protein, conserved [Trypanosoma brucei brucei TREU927]AAX79357.1 hypothetical protein, conserved [Trypanosoma brucei]AAZ11405.1 hypothetical protein, conserved [Trypanosoma brucei brucei TREU927]RHW72356.1 Ring finger domain containing protein [Trypanosoma brucei equiperdum]SCU65077.1 Ring finger domain containing protein, putative [Trypanosoma equiperdum]